MNDDKQMEMDEGEAQERKCEAGDIVTLRSGGPLMTAVKVDGDTVHCIWFTADENVRTAEIPLIALDPADDDFDFDIREETSVDEDAGDEDDEPRKKKGKKKHDH